MEDYYPSEIARLVLGYLDEVRCTKAWQTFLEESDNLHEHNCLLKQGKKCTTSVRGESLLDILKAYCVLKSFFEQIICQYSWKEVLKDVTYLQDQYSAHKQSTTSIQKTSQSVVNSLKEWISKISDSSSSDSGVNQLICSEHPFYPHLFFPLKNNEGNTSLHEKNCERTADKNIQTELLSSVSFKESKEQSTTQSVEPSEERSECLENNVIDSTSDRDENQNKLPGFELQEDMVQISEGHISSDSANKNFSPESSSFGQPLSLSTPENDQKSKHENNKSSEGKSLQVKRNLFKDISLSSSLHLSETPSKLPNVENVIVEEAVDHVVEPSEAAKPRFDECRSRDSNFSSNAGANVKENITIPNETFVLAEEDKNVRQCTEGNRCTLSAKKTVTQIPAINQNAATSLVVQEVPSDNNSSFVNSEHELQIIESELDSDVVDNEMNVNDISTAVSVHISNLNPVNNKIIECSNSKNKLFSPEKGESVRNSTTDQTQPMETSFENNATSNIETIDKTETVNENSDFDVFSNEIHDVATIDHSKNQINSEANENISVNTSHETVISRFDSMCNSQYSAVISPPNQTNSVFSYTIPNCTVPNTSSDLSTQNNIQYKIVLNTPISWNVPIGNGLSLVPPRGLSLVSPLNLSNVSNQVVFSPTKTTIGSNPPLPNVPSQVAFDPLSTIIVPSLQSATNHAALTSTATATVVSQVANFETVMTDNLYENVADLKKNNLLKQKDAPRKKQKVKEATSEIKSRQTGGKRNYSKRLPKRKSLSLFDSSPKSKKALPEIIPVLSITDPQSPSGSNSKVPSKIPSATKVITKITEEFEENCKSPVLKLLMTKAQELLKTNDTPNSSHIRSLDFNSKSEESISEDKILLTTDELKENNSKCSSNDNVNETLVEKEIINSKSVGSDDIHNENRVSKVNDKMPDYDENSNITTTQKKNILCHNKKIKSQKKNKEKKIDKKIITPQKSLEEIKNVKSNKSSKHLSKVQKNVTLQEDDCVFIQDIMKASPGKNKQKCNKLKSTNIEFNLSINEKRRISPRKRNSKNNPNARIQTNDAISEFQNKSFTVKTYENLNKIKKIDILKDDAIKELQKSGCESQNEKVVQEMCISESDISNKSSEKTNEYQNECTPDESPRKSLQMIDKMSSVSIEDNYKDVNIDLPKVSHNSAFESLREDSVTTTSENHLSSQKISGDEEHCKQKPSSETPRKSNRLQNKKCVLKNTDKLAFGECKSMDKNDNWNINEKNKSISPNEENKVSDKKQYNISVGDSQEINATDNEVDTLVNIKKVLFEDKNIQVMACAMNKTFKGKNEKNEAKCTSIKNHMTDSLENYEESASRIISSKNEIAKNKNPKKVDEKQKLYENETTRKESTRSTKLHMKNVDKSESKTLLNQKNTESNDFFKNSQTNYSMNDGLRKNITNFMNNNENKFEDSSEMLVFSDSSELSTVFNNTKSPEEKSESLKYNNVSDDNIKLNQKIVFNDQNFKLNEVPKNKDSSEQENNDNLQTSIQKDKLKSNSSEDSVVCLKDTQRINKDSINSTVLTDGVCLTKSFQQKDTKGCGNTTNYKTTVNKRKMAHPKKRINQNFLDVYDTKEDAQDNVEKLTQLALAAAKTVSILNNIEISNNSDKTSVSNLEVPSFEESNSKNLSCSFTSFSSENSVTLTRDDVFEKKEISCMENNIEFSKNYSIANKHSNVTNITKSSMNTIEILKDEEVKSKLNLGNDSLNNNSEDKLAYALRFSSSEQSENIVLPTNVEQKCVSNEECNLDTSHINSDVINKQDSSILSADDNSALVEKNKNLHEQENKNQSEENDLSFSSLNNNNTESEMNSSCKKYNFDIPENNNGVKQNAYHIMDIDTNNITSPNFICLSSNSNCEQTNTDIENHSCSDSFHSISSINDEDVSSNISSHIHNVAHNVVSDIPSSPTNVINEDSACADSNAEITNVRKRKMNEIITDSKTVSQSYKDILFDSPLSVKKRICRKLSSSSDEISSDLPESKSKEQKEISNLNNTNKISTAVKSLEVLKGKAKNKQNLSIKCVQDSPIRCVKKVKKVQPKTALNKKIEKDPRIPAGVKIPYKWSNSKIITYSNEICQSTKNTKKNACKILSKEASEKEGGSAVKQILKVVEHKPNNKEQNLQGKSPENTRLDKEPYVMLTKLSSNEILKTKQISNTEDKITKQNIILNADHEKIEINYDGNKTIGLYKPEGKLSQNITPDLEITQDIVEADIGRSHDEGSELAIAIKNCEKELLSPKSVITSHTPGKKLTNLENNSVNQSEKEVSYAENKRVIQPEKKTPRHENKSENKPEKKPSVTEDKLAMIRRLVEAHGTDWFMKQLDKIEKS